MISNSYPTLDFDLGETAEMLRALHLRRHALDGLEARACA